MSKTAVIGASGYIGRHLWMAYRQTYSDCLGTSFTRRGEGLVPFDIRRPDIGLLRLEEKGYRAVLIASAKPNIALCETCPDDTYAVNVRGTLELMRQIGRIGLQVIFLSSDYVFDGRTGRYQDNDATGPSTEYGRQKAEVERELPSLAENFLILRLSKIYGVTKGDGTLLDELASRLVVGDAVWAATDQVFSPTRIDDLVNAVLEIQASGMRGIVNTCSPEQWSRYDIAVRVARAVAADPGLVKPVSLHELPGMAGRPLNTSLACVRLTRETGVRFSPLEESLTLITNTWPKGNQPA